MTPATWNRVHVGDTVRGADGRTWVVCERRPGPKWLLQGEVIRFALRNGEREVRIERGGDDPAPVIASADHSVMAAIVDQLVATFGVVEVLGEYETKEESSVTVEPTAPVATVKRDRWGRYLLPHPETGKEQAWTRVSTVARTLADEYGLTQWKMRMVAKGLSLRPDLIAGAAAAHPEQDKDALNDIATKAMERAESSAGANFGTALHTLTQRIDRGDAAAAYDVPEGLAADLSAYTETLRRHRLSVVPGCIERIVALPDLGVAGTFDRVVTQPPGKTNARPHAVMDLKTARDLSYSWLEIAMQEAMYSRAPFMWDPAKQCYVPMPEVDRDRGLVLHLPVGAALGVLYGVNLIKGWEYAQIAMQVRAARSGAKSLGWLVDPAPEELAVHRVARAASRQELAALWDQYHPTGLWTDEVNTAAMARAQELAKLATTVVA